MMEHLDFRLFSFGLLDRFQLMIKLVFKMNRENNLTEYLDLSREKNIFSSNTFYFKYSFSLISQPLLLALFYVKIL